MAIFYPPPPVSIGGAQPYAPRLGLPQSGPIPQAPQIGAPIAAATFAILIASWRPPFFIAQYPADIAPIIPAQAAASAPPPVNLASQSIIRANWAAQDVQTVIGLASVAPFLGQQPAAPDNPPPSSPVNFNTARARWNIPFVTPSKAGNLAPFIPAPAAPSQPPILTYTTLNLIIAQSQPAQWLALPHTVSKTLLPPLPAPDTTPDQFSGQTLAGQALSATVTFDPVTPVGYNAAVTITVTNGLYSINSGAYTSSSGTLNPGDYFTARNTASASYLTNVDTVVTVGGVSATYRSITLIDPSIVSKNIKIDFGFGFGF